MKMDQSSMYDIIWGDSALLYNYPSKANIFLFDPPFYPRDKAYKQLRMDNDINLKPIMMPEDWCEWFDSICWIADKRLTDDGWFIFKADSITFLIAYPILSKYFHFYREIIWDKNLIGLGTMVRMRHELIIMCYRNKKKPFWNYRVNPESKKMDYNTLDGEKTIIKIEGFHGSSKGIAFPSVLNVQKYANGTFGKKNKDTHINETPSDLWDMFLEFCVPENGLIVDSCMGSGSILKSMIRLNDKLGRTMSYWGIEIDESYRKTLLEYLNNNIIQYIDDKNE